MAKFLDNNGLLYFWGKVTAAISAAVATKQDKLPTVGSADNGKLVGVNNAAYGLITPATSPTSGSGAPITSGAVYTALAGKQDSLPATSSADNGKFLRVVNGVYALATVPEAAGEDF